MNVPSFRVRRSQHVAAILRNKATNSFVLSIYKSGIHTIASLAVSYTHLLAVSVLEAVRRTVLVEGGPIGSAEVLLVLGRRPVLTCVNVIAVALVKKPLLRFVIVGEVSQEFALRVVTVSLC